MKLRRSDVIAAVIAGLLLGAIVHIIIVLRIPAEARQDAHARLVLAGEFGEATPLPQPFGLPGAMGDDPLTPRSACAFNLADGPVRITMPSSGLPQTLAIYDRGGRAIFSLSDRAAVEGMLSLLVMTTAQQEERRLAEEDDEDNVVEVVSPTERGLAVARAAPPTPAWRERAVQATTNVTCQPDE